MKGRDIMSLFLQSINRTFKISHSDFSSHAILQIQLLVQFINSNSDSEDGCHIGQVISEKYSIKQTV